MPAVSPSPQQPQPNHSAGAVGDGGRDLAAMSFPGVRRIAGWLFWVILPVLCLGAITLSVKNVASNIGRKPAGIVGTFVVTPRSCNQGICSFGGKFTSDDGTIKNMSLLGDPRWQASQVHRVTYNGKSAEVVALPGHWDPTASVLAVIGSLTYLGLLGYCLKPGSRRPRRPAAARTAAVSY